MAALDRNILLYNKVKLDDNSVGIVRYIGIIADKKGIYYGIDLTKGTAKNKGTVKGIQYFQTKNGKKTGRFVSKKKIISSSKTTFSKYPFKLNDVVICIKTKCRGTIKYIGVPSWAGKGKVYYGLVLKKKKGTCNGTNNGIKYFNSKPGFGIYVKPKDIKKVKKKKDAATDDIKMDQDDVKSAMRDYYTKNTNAKSVGNKKKKNKKKKGKKKKKKDKKKKTPKLLSDDGLDDNLPVTAVMTQQSNSLVIDYMDEEKDGIDLQEYQAKNDVIDIEKEENLRREEIKRMKQQERLDRLKRENDKKNTQNIQKNNKLLEKEKKERLKQKRLEQDAIKRQNEILKKQKELKDKERLEKYAAAMKAKELKEQKELQELKLKQERQRKAKELALQKQKERDAIKKQKELEKQQREKERLLAAKLRKQREQKENEQKMNKKPATIVKSKPPVSPVTSNVTSSVSASVAVKCKYTNKQINDEMTKSYGKNLSDVNMIFLDKYGGEIPLILDMLGCKLVEINKWELNGLFHPEHMTLKSADNPMMMFANNIYVYFTRLPKPLLYNVSQSILNKAINKDAMNGVTNEMNSPYGTILTWLWDILGRVAQHEKINGGMGPNQIGRVFGPLVTMVTKSDTKGNRVSMNVLAASRMMAFFRRGIEWRMDVMGISEDSSDDDDD